MSYAFDFRGPSLAVDTACSSSLVATQLACESLRKGEATLALAGGVNVILSPEISANFARGGFLAADGRCKSFDARADGYVRGEGRRLAVAACRWREPWPTAIRSTPSCPQGGAVNQDGRANGLTAPNRQLQEDVLRTAYTRWAEGLRPTWTTSRPTAPEHPSATRSKPTRWGRCSNT